MLRNCILLSWTLLLFACSESNVSEPHAQASVEREAASAPPDLTHITATLPVRFAALSARVNEITHAGTAAWRSASDDEKFAVALTWAEALN
jgi:hypothetical protein